MPQLPITKKAKTYEKSLSSNQLIPLNKEFEWPNIIGLNGDMIDISRVIPPEARTAYIVYLKNISEWWFGITNLKSKLGFGLVWDKNIFKHIWMWNACRGSQGYPWYGRTYNIAIEPWSSLPDNFGKVLKNGDFVLLEPGEIISTKYVAIVYKSDKRIEGFNRHCSPIIR